MRTFLLSLSIFLMFGLAGCGGDAGPASPTTLTADEEQEILDQVEGAAAEEAGQTQ